MRVITTIFVALTALSLSAQTGRREIPTDSGLVALHHFKNGKVSTREWTDKEQHWGRSFAYDQSGKEIFSYQTRRIGGHASARFSYHPNGAVSKVEVSDAPDGGIQWYKSTTTFDEAGKQIGFFEYGRDNDGIIPRIDPEPRKTVVPVYQPEVVECQKMFVNELFVVNPTPSACRVVALAKRPSPAMTGGTFTMAPGDTIRIGTYSVGEVFPTPDSAVDLDIFQVELGNTRKAVARYRIDHVQVTDEHRRHYVVIEGWTTTRSPEQEHLPGSPWDRKDKGREKPRTRFRLRIG